MAAAGGAGGSAPQPELPWRQQMGFMLRKAAKAGRLAQQPGELQGSLDALQFAEAIASAEQLHATFLHDDNRMRSRHDVCVRDKQWASAGAAGMQWDAGDACKTHRWRPCRRPEWSPSPVHHPVPCGAGRRSAGAHAGAALSSDHPAPNLQASCADCGALPRHAPACPSSNAAGPSSRACIPSMLRLLRSRRRVQQRRARQLASSSSHGAPVPNIHWS